MLISGSGTRYYGGTVAAATNLTSQRNTYTTASGDAYQGSPSSISLSVGMSTTAYGTTYTCEFGAVDTSGYASSAQKAVKMDATNYTQSYQVVSLAAGSVNWGSISYVYAKYISDDGTGTSSTIFVKGAQDLTVNFSYSYHDYYTIRTRSAYGWDWRIAHVRTASGWVACDVYRRGPTGWVLMGESGNG